GGSDLGWQSHRATSAEMTEPLNDAGLEAALRQSERSRSKGCPGSASQSCTAIIHGRALETKRFRYWRRLRAQPDYAPGTGLGIRWSIRITARQDARAYRCAPTCSR